MEIKELNLQKIPEKILMFSDIHWGAKNNSILHNQDNLDFLKFVEKQIKIFKPDALAFLGDWFENRNAINVLTQKMSYEGLKLIQSWNIPVFFILGNHDLYHRHNRDVHSIAIFQEFSNFYLIESPTKVGEHLFVPFLFKHEYPEYLGIINSSKYVYGHFEFKGFVLTGVNTKMEHGPDHTGFNKPEFIFSGHYHKRQITDNVIYIGNCFPTNYGDVGDSARGVCILDTRNDDVKFVDWPKCPMYFRVNLSTLIEGDWTPVENSRITCTKDVEISYTEVQALKEEFIKAFSLREFKIDEKAQERKDAIAGEGQELDIDALDSTGLDDTIQKLITSGVQKTTSIDPVKLAEEYAEL